MSYYLRLMSHVWPKQAIITGIKMQLFYFIDNVPVYTYFINGVQFNYINHDLKITDLL